VDNKPPALIEAKYGDSNLSSNFKVFEKSLGKTKNIQLACELDREKTFPDGTEIRKAPNWLANMNFLD
jgi:uncharacterized protein